MVEESRLRGVEEERDGYEAETIERKEIEGEWLTELEAKGYRLAFHNETTPCFSCSLSRIIRELPLASPSSPAPEGGP